MYRFIKYLVAMFMLASILYGAYLTFIIPFPKGSVVVQPNGGLGNQMFQYAAAYSLAQKTNSKLYVIVDKKSEQKGNKSSADRNFALKLFEIPEEQIIYTNKLNKYFLKMHLPLVSVGGMPEWNSLKKRVKKYFKITYVNDATFFEYFRKNKNNKILFLNDYFESEIFFKKYKNEILKIFSLKIPQDKIINDTIKQVSQENSVCIHIRNGDMATSGYTYYLPLAYQQQAIKLVKEIKTSPKYFIFSDTPDIVKQEFKNLKDAVFLNGSPKEDFMVMSNCKTNINANSTFSWWAAYLNQDKDHLVIVPNPMRNSLFHINVYQDDNVRFQKVALSSNFSYPKNWIGLDYDKINLAEFAKTKFSNQDDIEFVEKNYTPTEFNIYSGDGKQLKLCKGETEFSKNICFKNKMDSSITIVTALYNIQDNQQFIDKVKQFLKTSRTVIVFTDEEGEKIIKKYRGNLPILIIVKEIKDMEYYKFYSQFDRFAKHDYNNYVDYDNNKHLNYLFMLSQPLFVKEAIKKNIYNSNYYLWYNINQNINLDQVLENININDDKISLFMMQGFNYIEIINKFVGNDSVRINNKLILGDKIAWTIYASLWHKTLNQLINKHIHVRNDQVLMGTIAISYPELFNLIYPANYYSFTKNFEPDI